MTEVPGDEQRVADPRPARQGDAAPVVATATGARVALLLRLQRGGDCGQLGLTESKVKDATHEAVTKLGRLLGSREGGAASELARRPATDPDRRDARRRGQRREAPHPTATAAAPGDRARRGGSGRHRTGRRHCDRGVHRRHRGSGTRRCHRRRRAVGVRGGGRRYRCGGDVGDRPRGPRRRGGCRHRGDAAAATEPAGRPTAAVGGPPCGGTSGWPARRRWGSATTGPPEIVASRQITLVPAQVWEQPASGPECGPTTVAVTYTPQDRCCWRTRSWSGPARSAWTSRRWRSSTTSPRRRSARSRLIPSAPESSHEPLSVIVVATGTDGTVAVLRPAGLSSR